MSKITSACIIGVLAYTQVQAGDELAVYKAAELKTNQFAMVSRQMAADDGFESFKRSVYKEPFENGVYIVNGDTPIRSDEELREFFLKEIKANWKSEKFGLLLSTASAELIADAPQGNLATWDNIQKKNLTYCISKSFGDRYPQVVSAMKEATQAWENVSDIKYTHLIELDQSCDEKTSGVVFDVRPVNVSGQYLARAFFPRYPRLQRNVLIDESSFNLPAGKLTLTGILRHELGHTLSYRHEHTRPEAGKCFEDSDWKPLTNYDAFSVMHYPQCNGLGDWSLNLTEKDKVGAACLYGSSPLFSITPSQCKML